MSDQTVFEWLEDPPHLPQVLTVERSTQSKYQFYLLVRHFRKRTRPKPTFLTYVKAEQSLVKGSIEEHSIWDNLGAFYVLDGFSQKFVETLDLPKDTIVLAETDGGLLKSDPYRYNHKLVRAILRVLLTQLNITHLSLRELLKLDWSSMRSFEEYETFLWKVRVMEWDVEKIEKELGGFERGNVLTLTKRGQFGEIFQMMEKYGASWLYNHTLEMISELMHYRALRVMGYDEDKCQKELEIGWARAKDLEEANKMLTAEDLLLWADRAVWMDGLISRDRELGLSLFFLNNPIRVNHGRSAPRA